MNSLFLYESTDAAVPINTVPPVISGTPLIGNVLTTTNGTWTSDTGVTGYTYQWYRGASPIGGATNNTYTLVQADAAENITCQVVAIDSDGASLPATSNILTENSFVALWKTDNLSSGSSANNTITLPLEAAGTYSGTIHWGDGTTSALSFANRTKVYAAIGTYKIAVTAAVNQCIGFRFAGTGDRFKLLNIQRWGNLRVGNNNGYFFGCINMIVSASDDLNITGTTNMQSMFQGCTSLNQNIGASWNTSAVTLMANMFQGCSALNQNIGASWNLSAATNIQEMFRSCSALNQNIGASWNVSNASNMTNMFNGCTSLNQPIGQTWTLRTAGVNLAAIFSNSGLNTTNYTATIVYWANQVWTNGGTPASVSMATQIGRTFTNANSGGANFADAGAARAYLTGALPHPTGAGWTISGDTVI